MYTPNDIQVFFFAHDRPDFLAQALDSYLAQTVQGAELVVLANAPSDALLQRLESYKDKGVKIVLEKASLGVYGCTKRCQEMASRPIVVMAHDDDLIHPAYLETLLKAYNQIPDLNVALSAMGDWDGKPFSTRYHTRAAVLDRAHFSAYIFMGCSFTFSSCSYKTAHLQTLPGPDFAHYGKVKDVPYMVDACGGGKAAVLQFPFVKYRIHQAQDSQTYSTGPTAKEWIELELFHKQAMEQGGKSLQTMYARNIYHRLKIGWRDWCLCEHGKMTFVGYLQLARQMGALTFAQQVWGWLLRGNVRQKVLKGLFPLQQTELQ